MAALRRESATRFTKSSTFNEHGQLLNASLADYLLPTALDVPRMELGHTVTKSPLNPMGIKGAGEAGAIPVGPLFAQAIEDALDLKGRGVELLEIPLSPEPAFRTDHGLTRHERSKPPRSEHELQRLKTDISMILVTGAAGKTGKAIIKALLARGAPVRAFVRSPAHEAILKTIGLRETVAGEMDDPHALSLSDAGRGGDLSHLPERQSARGLICEGGA